MALLAIAASSGGTSSGHWGGLGLEGGDDSEEHGLAPVGRLAGEQLVEHRAEQVDVGAGVDRGAVARRQLGGHVGGGTEHLADVAGAGQELGQLVAGAHGDAPVEQVGLAVVAEHDVARLEVEVDDAAGVGVVDGVADLGQRAQLGLEGLFSAAPSTTRGPRPCA